MQNVAEAEKAGFFAAVDAACKKAVWCAIATVDGNLTQFGSTGPDDPNVLPVRITPTRVELSEMFGSMNKRVWRP